MWQTLEVDPFAGGLGRDEDLDRALPELLLGVERVPGLSREPPSCPPWMHPTVKPQLLSRSTR